MSPSRVGPFALEQPIAGSSGSLYRAIHVEQKLAVTVKLFSVPFGVGDATKNAFASEASTLKTMKHPNIVRCYGGAIATDQAYLAHEFIEGETLAELLEKRGRLLWEQVVDIASQISAGLEFAHERKIVHAAIAPDKILITSSGQVKIADFRIQRHGGLNPPVSLTMDRVAYLAPEQVTPNGAITERTDVYVFGCMLFRMITGTDPFIANDVKSLAQMHREVLPLRVTTQAMDCPVWLDKLIEQMLSKDPNSRPYTAAAVRLALEETQKNIADGRGVAEHAARGVSALRMGQDREEARNVLGRTKKKKDRKKRKQSDAPFYESVGFLVGALITLTVVVGILLIPPSEEKMWGRAESLLASGDRARTRQAVERHLRPMLVRFPKGEHADEARHHVDQFEMNIIEKRMKMKINTGGEPKNKNELLLMTAWRFLIFGDKQKTKEECERFLDRVKDVEENRTLRLLAERRISKIDAEDSAPPTSKEYLELKLNEADDLVRAEKSRSARRIWRSITELYREREFPAEVAEADEALKQYETAE